MNTRANQLWWVLRIGAAACFIGHGAFGIIGKQAWLPFFALVGIGPDVAFRLMPIIGTVDILAGLSVLFKPRPVVLLYMTVWALWTASLRPLTGDAAAELIERAGNYGVPLALLVMCEWPRRIADWFGPAQRRAISERLISHFSLVLLATTATLLAGHAVLGLTGKPLLVSHYEAVGIDNSMQAAHGVGRFELLLGVILLASPTPVVAAFITGWKLATEGLFLIAGAPAWEFVERGGSYAAPLALLILSRWYRLPRLSFSGLVARPRITTTALLVLLVSTTRSVSAQGVAPSTVAGPSDGELLTSLQRGGFALACRHSITDHTHEDQIPVNLTDRATQRNLSAAGEQQARDIGAAIRSARIPVGQVYANPLFRTRETAMLAFGNVTSVDSLGDNGVLGRMLMPRVPVGENRVFVTRNGMLMNAMRGVKSVSFEEGDCVIVEPRDSTFRFVAKLKPADLTRLAGGVAPAPPSVSPELNRPARARWRGLQRFAGAEDLSR